jgi:hypothetical protein
MTDADPGHIDGQGHEGVSVSPNTLSELQHGEVAYVLRAKGIRVLHIKGPTVTLWLYGEGERAWGDVDVLVHPGDLAAGLGALRAIGYVDRHPGIGAGVTEDHAVTLVHRRRGSATAEIDVHSRFEGIGLEPAAAFEVLWARREPEQLAHTPVWFPDLATRALLLCLNAARDLNSRTGRDLERVVAVADDDDWATTIRLGRRLDALPAMKAGLVILPRGRAVVARTELASLAITTEWSLRLAHAPRTALRLNRLLSTPWRAWPTVVARWLLPPPAVIRMRDPRARAGRKALAVGYIRRIGDGVSAVVPSVRALVAARAGRSPAKWARSDE